MSSFLVTSQVDMYFI